MSDDGVEAAYRTVTTHSRRAIDLEKTDQLLRWDSDVTMPPGGTRARSSQRSSVTAARRRFLGAPELSDALATLSEADIDGDRAAVVREVGREHDVVTSVPDDLADEIGRVTAEAHETWKRAYEADDWSQFGPTVERHFECKREWAEHVDPDRDPYEVVWSERTGYLSQPYLPLETVETIFDDLRGALVPLVEDVRESDVELATEALRDPSRGIDADAREQFDVDTQERLARAALDFFDIEWDRTRFDAAPHPFSMGTPFDVRMTTRYDETDLTDALLATIHEFGHTAYAHGLPGEHYGTPLAEPRGLGVHESQSRFFENHVARSEPFWEAFLPTVADHFPELADVTPREAYECVNQVHPDNAIRVDADELTYHMHVVLRTEIERDLFAGDIDASDVPAVWNDKMEAYLGVRPDSDREGCLQDPHWSNNVPGFIGYTVGSVLAAQIDAAMREDLDVDELVGEGDVGPIREWLTDRIHRHGSRYRTDELIERATGEPLTAEYFVEYVREKYGKLYDL